MATVAEQLASLADLVEKGFLTREQFEEERDRILAEARARSESSKAGPALPSSGIGAQPGAQFGGYALIELLGEGGMGRVFRARHTLETVAERQGGDVALKIVLPELARDERYRTRFQQEVELGLRLAHDGLVRMHEYVSDGDTLGVSMELIRGRSLADRLDAEGPLPADEVVRLFVGVLQAVGYAHAAGVVHRDLKPDNIMVRPDTGAPVILDFGIAKAGDAATRTRTGVAIGTANYMPPEQHRSASQADARSDVYAIGLSMYELLVGRLPWPDDADLAGVLMAKLQGDMPMAHGLNPAVPPALSAIVAKAASVRPEDRWPDTASFVVALLGADLATLAPEEEEASADDFVLEDDDGVIEDDEDEVDEDDDDEDEDDEDDEDVDDDDIELESGGRYKTVVEEPGVPEPAPAPSAAEPVAPPSAAEPVAPPSVAEPASPPTVADAATGPTAPAAAPMPPSPLRAHLAEHHRAWQVVAGVALLLAVPLITVSSGGSAPAPAPPAMTDGIAPSLAGEQASAEPPGSPGSEPIAQPIPEPPPEPTPEPTPEPAPEVAHEPPPPVRTRSAPRPEPTPEPTPPPPPAEPTLAIQNPRAVTAGAVWPIAIKLEDPPPGPCSVKVYYRDGVDVRRVKGQPSGGDLWEAEIPVPDGADTLSWWATARCGDSKIRYGSASEPQVTRVQ